MYMYTYRLKTKITCNWRTYAWACPHCNLNSDAFTPVLPSEKELTKLYMQKKVHWVKFFTNLNYGRYNNIIVYLSGSIEHEHGRTGFTGEIQSQSTISHRKLTAAWSPEDRAIS